MAVVANGDVRRWLLALSLIDTGEALVLLPALRRRAIAPATGQAHHRVHTLVWPWARGHGPDGLGPCSPFRGYAVGGAQQLAG